MAGAWTTKNIKDSGGSTVAMRVWDESGAGTGPFSFGQALTNGDGTTAPGAAAVGKLAAGSAIIGQTGIDQTTPGTTDSVTVSTAQGSGAAIGLAADAVVAAGAAGTISAKLRAISRDIVANIVLKAGTAIVGQVGIDQTTPGTTDSVTVSTAQGSGAAVGLAADAVVAAGAAGTLSAKLRAISRDLVANIVLAAGANTIGNVGLVAGTAKVGTVGSRFIQAAFATLTRPANATPYTANDAVSDNATPGSVTAISATVSDTNDDPISLERLRIVSTDTGLSNVSFRAWFYNSDPTASSGVGGGDNIAFSNKKAGFIGSMSGTFTAFSDGAVAVLAPDAGSRIIANPVSGARTLFVQLQTLSAFTPSANSTTFISTVEAFQGRT